MELEKIKGLAKATIQKLKEAGYKDVESLKGLEVKQLVEIGIKERLAKELLEKVKTLEKPQEEPSKDEFDLEKENKYLVAGFKATKEYNKELKGKKLEKAFNKFKGE